MRVVAADDEPVALVVDIIFVADAPRGDEQEFAARVVGSQQVRLVGDLVAGGDDDVAF